MESPVNAISINSLYKYGEKEVKCFADNITSYFYHQETLTKKTSRSNKEFNKLGGYKIKI